MLHFLSHKDAVIWSDRWKTLLLDCVCPPAPEGVRLLTGTKVQQHVAGYVVRVFCDHWTTEWPCYALCVSSTRNDSRCVRDVTQPRTVKPNLVLISVSGWADRGHSAAGMTPSGIEPAIFRLVAKRLNQQRHRGLAAGSGKRQVSQNKDPVYALWAYFPTVSCIHVYLFIYLFITQSPLPPNG
jgi:hypothetical protein